MERTLFDEEHEMFRAAVRAFIEKEVAPRQEKWREQGIVDRETWSAAGKAGLLCPWLEEKYGGPGGTFLQSVIVHEELAEAYESGFSVGLPSPLVGSHN